MSQPVETGREKPATYGRWWNRNALDEEWYEKIFDVRPRAHMFFLDWFGDLVRKGEEIRSILEIGCGRGRPYAQIFANYDFSGTDISEKEIEYCRKAYPQNRGRFFVADAIKDDLGPQHDIVFAHAVVDHVYDINLFLQKLAKAASSGWLYVSAYRGWFPSLNKHEYEWQEGYDCFNNRLSPSETRRALQQAGCNDIQVFPIFVGNQTDKIAMELVIIARGPRLA